MKAVTVLAIVFFVLTNIALFGQDMTVVTVRPLTDDDIAMLRADIQTQKTDIIGKTMKFNDAESKAFWPLYREYANEQQKIGDQRISLIKDYAAHYDAMNDANADDFMKRYLNYEKDNYDFRKKYYPKFKQAIGAKQAAKFYQVDNRLTLLGNVQLAQLIPIIR